MKKILFVLFSAIIIGLYSLVASASHMGIPTVDQQRKELVWSCVNIDDARTFVTAREDVRSYDAWIDILRKLVDQNRCMMGEIEYVVEEVVETISGLSVEYRSFGESITHYILKSDGHLIVTY